MVEEFKVAKQGIPFATSWEEAQEWCNFVLFQPTWLPTSLTEATNTMRPETAEEPGCHRAEFSDASRALSIKQFLYDWAPPAYDHPCLWRNAKISTTENTPLPRSVLIDSNCLWFGLDYRRKPAATINMMRTQVEITVLKGAFDDREITQMVRSLAPVSIKARDRLLLTSFAELMFNHRHAVDTSDVPTSYFTHKRKTSMRCYPHPAKAPNLKLNHWLADLAIEDYRLDSVLLYGEDRDHIQEVEYYFESLRVPGAYIRFLATPKDAAHSIAFPPKLGDQECNYAVHTLSNGEELHHAWSKTNDHGSHSLIFQAHDAVVNCLIKPAPWTTVDWAREVCEHASN